MGEEEAIVVVVRYCCCWWWLVVVVVDDGDVVDVVVVFSWARLPRYCTFMLDDVSVCACGRSGVQRPRPADLTPSNYRVFFPRAYRVFPLACHCHHVANHGPRIIRSMRYLDARSHAQWFRRTPLLQYAMRSDLPA